MRLVMSLIVVVYCLVGSPGLLRAEDKAADKVQDDARRQLREDARRQAEETVARNLLDQFISRAQETSTLLGSYQSKAEALLPRMQKMLANDEGRRLALDDTAFLGFVRLQEQPPANIEQIAAKRRTIDTTVEKLKGQLKDAAVGYVPPDSMKDEVEATRQWALDGVVRVNEAATWLDVAVGKAVKEADLAKAPTLKQRIDSYQASKIESLARSRFVGEQSALAENQQKVREAGRVSELMRGQEEADRLLREAKAQVERMRIEHEIEISRLREVQQKQMDDLNKQLAEAKANRLRQEAANDATVAKAGLDAEMTKKRQQCHDPHVQAVLAPFLGKGYLQPKSGKGIDAVPVSLSELRSIGALDADKKGLDALVKFANNPRNDRPHWGGYRDLRIPAEQLEKVKEGQGFLIDLGDALVAEGMLTK